MKENSTVSMESLIISLFKLIGIGLLLIRAFGLITWSWWIVLGVVFVLFMGVLFVSFINTQTVQHGVLPSEQQVSLAVQQLLGGQLNRVRCIQYRTSHNWRVSIDEEQKLYSHKAPDLGMVVTTGVNWASHSADNTPQGTQRMAEQYVKDAGGKILRNEISDIEGYPIVNCEYTLPNASWNKRVNLVLHRSEYNIVMQVDSIANYKRIAPVVKAFFDSLEICLPHLPQQTVLGGRVRIGIPPNWDKEPNESESLVVWKESPGPSTIRLHFVQDERQEALSQDIFLNLPGERCKLPMRLGLSQIPEKGLSTLYGTLKDTPETGHDPWSISAIQLPTGLVVALEFEHLGSPTDKFTDIQLVSTAFLTEIIATVEDARYDTVSTANEITGVAHSDRVGNNEALNREKAAKLTSEAFYLVEDNEYNSAIDLLKQATSFDSEYGRAYNELAFIYGSIRKELGLAEEYAQRAVECNPDNPKFFNTLTGIRLRRASRLKTRGKIRERMRQILQEIQNNIDNNPSYPPAYFSKSVALALSGESKRIWEAELKRGEELYLQRGINTAGLPLTPEHIKRMVTRNYNRCLEMSSHWKNTPEG